MNPRVAGEPARRWRHDPAGNFVVNSLGCTRQFYDRIVPGICDQFNGPAMLPLIAPRPLLVINGDSDDRTPLPELQLCTGAAQKSYHDARADDRFVMRIQQKTGHKVTQEAQREANE